jgi:hypothetical protein
MRQTRDGALQGMRCSLQTLRRCLRHDGLQVKVTLKKTTRHCHIAPGHPRPRVAAQQAQQANDVLLINELLPQHSIGLQADLASENDAQEASTALDRPLATAQTDPALSVRYRIDSGQLKADSATGWGSSPRPISSQQEPP